MITHALVLIASAAVGLYAGYLAVGATAWFPRPGPARPSGSIGSGVADGSLRSSKPQAGTECLSCGKPLTKLDMVSLSLWRASRPSCSGCGALLENVKSLPSAPRLLWQALTAVLFVAAVLRVGANVVLVPMDLVFAVLVTVTIVDLKHRVVPRVIVYTTLVAVAPLLAISAVVDNHVSYIGLCAAGGVASFGFFFLVHLLSPKGMGFGDVRLAGLVGTVLGWFGLQSVLAGFFLAFLTGALVEIILIAVFGGNRKTAMPFAPYLALGCVLGVMWGPTIASDWTHLLMH